MASAFQLVTEQAAEADTNVRENVRVLLAVTRRSGEDLAGALGLPPSSLSRRLSGKIPFSAKEVAACALFFGIKVGRLYENPAEVREHVIRGFSWTREARRPRTVQAA